MSTATATATRKTAPKSTTPQIGRVCTCGSTVVDEIDPRDDVTKPFIFDTYDDGGTEPALRLWSHTCATVTN